MNSLTEQQKSEIYQLGRIGFSFREVAANFDFDLLEVARQFREEQGEIYQNWYKGYLTAQAEIRKTVLDAALNSSQPAILQMLRYFRQADEDNLEAFETE